MPGTVISRSQPESSSARTLISADSPSIRSSSRRQSPAGEVLDNVHHARGQHLGRRGQEARQLSTQEALSLPHGDAALQQEGADLVDGRRPD